jgi:hypothetical protein
MSQQLKSKTGITHNGQLDGNSQEFRQLELHEWLPHSIILHQLPSRFRFATGIAQSRQLVERAQEVCK